MLSNWADRRRKGIFTYCWCGGAVGSYRPVILPWRPKVVIADVKLCLSLQLLGPVVAKARVVGLPVRNALIKRFVCVKLVKNILELGFGDTLLLQDHVKRHEPYILALTAALVLKVN